MGQARSARRGVAHDKCVVIEMDDRARAILDQARETLHRVRDVRVEHRSHDDDALQQWRAGMPTERPTTLADIDRKIAEHREVWLEVHGRVIASERHRHRDALAAVRKELRKAISDDRTLARHELNRQRADHDRMRASMLAETAQVRAKNAELELRLDGFETSKRAVDGSRVIDLPALPLRGYRAG
jgi:hypothetical protein